MQLYMHTRFTEDIAIVVYLRKTMDVQFVIFLTMTMSTTLIVRGMDLASIFTQERPDTCLNGSHHKAAPSRESAGFLGCGSWRDVSCCSAQTAAEIHGTGAVGLWNFHWDRCAPLSPQCEQYLKNQECFYQCEPMLKRFEKADGEGFVQNVPICRTYCEQWFDACKNDMTCVEDWLNDWHYEEDWSNNCPVNSTCVTFAEMYTDAEGLCDKMWGDAFYYEESNMNCMVMQFNPENNPNLYGNCEHNLARRSKSSRLSSSGVTVSVDFLCVLFVLCIQTLVFLIQ